MDKAAIKREAKALAELDNKYTLEFTKRELMIMYHWLAVDDDGKPRKYIIADGAVLYETLRKIQPLAVVSREQPPVEDHIETADAPLVDLGEVEEPKEIN